MYSDVVGLLLLVIALATSASAGVVGPARVPGATPSGPAVNFDGRWTTIGPMLIDMNAPGAAELVKSIADPQTKPLIGIFEVERAQAINAYALGSFGVKGHVDAMPQGRPLGERLGGYVLSVSPEGGTRFWGSGAYPATITPAVERSVLRYVGLRPAVETRMQRLRRLWLRLYDELAAMLRG